jgi:hypothetical protein
VVTAASASPKAAVCLWSNRRRLPSRHPLLSGVFPIYLPALPNQPRAPPSAARSAVIMHRRTQPSSRRFPLPIPPPARPCPPLCFTIVFLFCGFVPCPLPLLLACEPSSARLDKALSLGFSPAFGFPLFSFFTLGYLSLFRLRFEALMQINRFFSPPEGR